MKLTDVRYNLKYQINLLKNSILHKFFEIYKIKLILKIFNFSPQASKISFFIKNDLLILTS